MAKNNYQVIRNEFSGKLIFSNVAFLFLERY